MLSKQADITLTPEQIAEFHDRGFLAIPRITTDEELAKIREIFESLFTAKVGWQEGAQFDLVAPSENQASTLTQIIHPVNYAPALRGTLYRANALSIARQLLGKDATPSFEHSIMKPPAHGSATPWHQDEAYRVAPQFHYEQLSIWMALQDTSLENGCMQYMPGSHKRGILPHHKFNDDPKVHSIECLPENFNASEAVAVPLPAGGAVFHHGRMLHYAGPNHTLKPRYAYTLAFELPPVPLSEPRNFAWNENKQSAEYLRRRDWLKRGGFVLEVLRRSRYGNLHNPKRLVFEIKRVMQYFTKSRGQ